MKKLIVVGIIILGLCLTSLNAMADVVVENVIFDPETLSPETDVSVIANISGLNQGDNVYFTFKECDAKTGLCDDPVNESMTNVEGTDDYTIDITLSFNSATYLDYWFVVESNGNWTEYKSDSYRVQYDLSTGNGGDDNGGNNDTPGFELLIFLVAIFVGIIILRKKR